MTNHEDRVGQTVLLEEINEIFRIQVQLHVVPKGLQTAAHEDSEDAESLHGHCFNSFLVVEP